MSRVTIEKAKELGISEEMIEKLSALSAGNVYRRKKFTKEQDDIIWLFWDETNKDELAKLLGTSQSTLRRRYRELKEKRE